MALNPILYYRINFVVYLIRMRIDEIIIKLCELDSRDEMETFLQDEMDRVEVPEYRIEKDDYIGELYDVYGYLIRGKFRDKKPIYQKLMDKVDSM